MELNSFSLIKKSIISSDNDKIAGLYNIGSTIGKGHYAVVKEAKHAFTGEKVAIKVIDKTKLDIQSREHLFSEVMCMKLVQHPNVVRLYEVIDTVHKLYLVLELGDGGDLYDYIMKFENGLPEIKAKRYFRQIVQAIAYCHNLHVVHRDLKPENVVFFEKVELVKLTDFGFSNKFTPGKTLDTSCGSLAYSAPEILLGDAYDAPKIDIWSLGVILYMLVCGHLPFEEANDSETLSKIMDCKYDLPSHLSECCKNLIKTMLVRDPEKRANLEEILSDKWLEYENENNYVLDSFSVPLISQEHLTVEEHVDILTKMSEGNLASVEEIQLILDRNEYSYISATYFLLAERKLKRRYLENYCRMKLLQEIEKETSMKTSATQDPLEELPANNVISPITETNEDRIRRFSMILEDEEDEAEEEELEAMISLASVREELELTVPKFEVFSQSGISAPFPSRCCSRLSDSIDQDPTDLDTNYRFSAFRHQFTTRNRCRSAIYNRRSLIYSSHSLSSIPNFSQLLNDIHEENNSNNGNNGTGENNPSTITSPNKYSRLKSLLSPINGAQLPRFQRNFSGTFQRRTNSTERSFDDNFHYLSSSTATKQQQQQVQQRISLPNGTHHIAAKKRCSYPALFPSAVNSSNLSQSHSSSDVSDTEISLLRGFNERKKVLVPKSFPAVGGKQNYQNFFAPKYIGLKPHTPDLMMSTSSIDSDASFAGPATAPKFFCQQSANRRLRIKSGRSRPSSMGATFEEFQSLCVVSGMMISEENNQHHGSGHSNTNSGSSSNNNNNNNSSASSPNPTAIIAPLSSSPTVGNITLHRDICAPIHEEEELIRSRSYIDKDTTSTTAASLLDGSHQQHQYSQHQSSSLSINLSSRRSVSGDCGRRKSDSVEGTPARWALSRCHASQTSKQRQMTVSGSSAPPLQQLDSHHSLSSQLTQSNFSLSSFASSLRGSKAMMNLVRGAFELQCAANRLRTSPADCCRHHSASVSTTNRCASATVSGRQSRCEYASVTSLPLGNKLLLHSPIDDDDERSMPVAAATVPTTDGPVDRLLLFGQHGGDSSNNEEEDGDGKPVAVAFRGSGINWTGTQRKNGMKKKSISHSADQIGGGGSSSGNPFIRAGSNMSRKARFILSCCRPS